MSATRDKSQKPTFVYSNLYQLYRKGKDAAKAADPAPAPQAPREGVSPGLAISKGQVIKPMDLNQGAEGTVKVSSFRPAEFIGKRVAAPAPAPVKTPAVSPVIQAKSSALDSLKQNLETLSQLHSRLRFMLQELEDLVKE